MSEHPERTATALPVEALYTRCDPAALPFETTAELEPLEEIGGQRRTAEAVRFAVGMAHDGYNLFAFGPEGTGKYSFIRRYLERAASEASTPPDWCYVNNFEEPHRPKALNLPAGNACPFRDDMAQLVEELKLAIPAAFESDEHRNRKPAIQEQFKERQEEGFGKLQARAKEHDIALIRTPVGLALAPIRDGEVLNPKEFDALPEDEKQSRRAVSEDLQKDLEALLHQIPGWEREQRQELRDLDRETTMFAVGHLIDELKRKWQEETAVIAHLEAVSNDVIDNAEAFLPREAEGPQILFGGKAPSGSAIVRRYQVNVIVDQTRRKDARSSESAEGAPVVYEDHPTQPNLVGRTEHIAQFGTLVTDFNLIKGGALHRANGGWLILDAHKLLTQPYAWESLKRALRSERIRIESPAESLGWATTTTLEPEPIPLAVKIVLLGEPLLYYLLMH